MFVAVFNLNCRWPFCAGRRSDDGLVEQASEKLRRRRRRWRVAGAARAQTAAPPHGLCALQQKKDLDGAERGFKEALALNASGRGRTRRIRARCTSIAAAQGGHRRIRARMHRLAAPADRMSKPGAADVTSSYRGGTRRARCAPPSTTASATRSQPARWPSAAVVSHQQIAGHRAKSRRRRGRRQQAPAWTRLGAVGVGKKGTPSRSSTRPRSWTARDPCTWWSLGLTQREAGHFAEAATVTRPRHAKHRQRRVTRWRCGRRWRRCASCAKAKNAAASLGAVGGQGRWQENRHLHSNRMKRAK